QECLRCGHMVVKDNPSFRCSCPKCGELTRKVDVPIRDFTLRGGIRRLHPKPPPRGISRSRLGLSQRGGEFAMPNERREDLDRRDFMMAAIGLVCASASLASSAGTANAQDTKAPPVGQRTVYTGDVIQGKKVISALDVNDLERGKKHAF